MRRARRLPPPGSRIVVVGTSGSGKSTTGRRLARALGCPHIELDALHWEPDWTPAPDDVFRARVAEATAAPRWVADGNYNQVRDLTWGCADTIVWLDFPFPVVLWRLTARTFRRTFRGEELWNGNREVLRNWVSRDSLFLWVLKTHWSRRPRYRALLDGEYRDRRAVHLRSPRAAERWLRAVERRAGVEAASGARSRPPA